MASRTKKQQKKAPKRRRAPRPRKDPDLCEAGGCHEPRFADYNVCLGHLVEFQGPELAAGAAVGWGLDPTAAELLGGLAAVFAPTAGRLANQSAARLRGGAPQPAEPPPAPPPPRREPTALEQLELLGFRPAHRPPLKGEVEAFRRHMARVYHSDAGGTCIDPDMMGRINAACDAVVKENR